jgi:hypothetical protein
MLRQRPWSVRPERFVLAGVPPEARRAALAALADIDAPFAQLIVEPDLITILAPEQAWPSMRAQLAAARADAPFRVISFDLDLPADLVGFLAAVSQAIAGAGVPILAICGYTKDHMLVREQHLAAALGALEALAG